MEGVTHKLKYRLIEASSEDPDHPLYELMRGTSSNGWMSVRFCTFPQEIIIQFLTPVNLKQINILSNEKKITSMIEFYSYYPSSSTTGGNPNSDFYKNYKRVTFQKLGYIRMDSNSRTNYKAREYRKVFINTNCIYLKLVLNKNYVNKYNVFNQVGLISLDFLGIPFNMGKSEFYLSESLKDFEFREEDLDDVSQEKIKILKSQQDEAIKNEDYDEAKRLKVSIDKIKFVGRKIFEMETQKKVYINNEDFDNAKIIKFEIDRLKSSLKYIDRNLNIVPYNNLSMEINKSSEGEENKEILKDNILDMSKSIEKEREVSFSINSDQNPVEKSSLNRSIRSIEKIKEEDMISYDEKIIPTVLKKLNTMNNTNINNTSSLTIDELPKEEIPIKNELEPLDSSIKQPYEILIKYVGEDCIRKIFSKQIAWKEEGFDILNNMITKIISDGKKKNEINLIINQMMKLINTFLNDRLPQICLRSMHTFYKLLTEMKKSKIIVQYDSNITDSILSKIKEKLGDVKIKLRRKAIELYCHMLNQDFCDYNNLLLELVEDELKQIDNKRYNRSSKIVYGKLLIFDNVFDNLEKVFKEKRSDLNQFPLLEIATYVIENISNTKSEIRKLDRTVVMKIYKIFGFKKIEPLLKKVDIRELEKLIKDIPEVSEIIKQNNLKNNPNISTRIVSKSERDRSPGRSSSGGKKTNAKKESQNKKKENNNNNNSINSQKVEDNTNNLCIHCGRSDLKIPLNDHIEKECVIYFSCQKCNFNLEVKNYTNHMLNECEYKKDFKLCKRCKEAIDLKDYDFHVRENKCNPAKHVNSSNRCPLCHRDIPPHDKGFYQHLVKDICQKHKRREKIMFVNGR